jgi:hypothetical protein
MDIAAGSGMIVNGAVVCACSDCKLARMYLGEDN